MGRWGCNHQFVPRLVSYEVIGIPIQSRMPQSHPACQLWRVTSLPVDAAGSSKFVQGSRGLPDVSAPCTGSCWRRRRRCVAHHCDQCPQSSITMTPPTHPTRVSRKIVHKQSRIIASQHKFGDFQNHGHPQTRMNDNE